MALKEKLALLNLSAEQERIAIEKFLVTLSLVSDEDLSECVSFLTKEGVAITKAREVKVVANSKDEIAKKFSILGELHETAIYKQDPTMLNKNVIDLYRRIQYCRQNGLEYKNEDGTYKTFLLSEAMWQKELSNNSVSISTDSFEKPAGIVTIEPSSDNVESQIAPVSEDNIIDFQEYVGFSSEPVSDELEKETSHVDNMIDIQEYIKNNNDEAELDAKTTDFATIKEELKAALADLDAVKNSEFGELSFNDIEPETFGMGRVA